MSGEDGWSSLVCSPAPAPGGALLHNQIISQDQWTSFNNTVNAISLGFVATAILVSMFLVMALFEKLLRARSPPGRLSDDVEALNRVGGYSADYKLSYSSPQDQISEGAKEVSVLMPGHEVPTCIAHPAPLPCPPRQD